MKKLLLHTCCAPCLIHPLGVLKSSGYAVVPFFYNPNIHPYSEYLRRLRAFEEYCRDLGLKPLVGQYDMERFFYEVSEIALEVSSEGNSEHLAAAYATSRWIYRARVNFERIAGVRYLDRMAIPGTVSDFAPAQPETVSGSQGNNALRIPEHSNDRCAACYSIRLKRTAFDARCLDFGFFSTTLLASPYQDIGLVRSAGYDAGIEYGVLFVGDDFSGGYAESMRTSRKLGMYRQSYCGCVYSERQRLERSRG